jgi:predicted helicase
MNTTVRTYLIELARKRTNQTVTYKNLFDNWSLETENASYIFDLLLSVINVSVQTVGIVEGLPKVKFE